MSGKEILIFAVGVFLTITAWMIIDLYHISEAQYINRDIPPVNVPKFQMNTQIFPTLAVKQP